MLNKLSLVFLLLLGHSLARADDWGCQVALCISNPAGPMAVAECVAPMQRLYNALAHKQGWPTCGMAQAPAAPPPQFNPVTPSQLTAPGNAQQGPNGNIGTGAQP